MFRPLWRRGRGWHRWWRGDGGGGTGGGEGVVRGGVEKEDARVEVVMAAACARSQMYNMVNTCVPTTLC